jgi:hypothetical protein
MRKADIALGVDEAIQWHPSQLEQVDLLPVDTGNRMVGVGQAGEGDVLILPILPKDRRLVGSYSQDLRAAAGELFIAIPQARQLRAAIWSHEPAQEREHHRLAAKIG